MNKIIGLVLVIYAMSLMSCEKLAVNLCGGSDPATDLMWLNQEINRLSPSPNCNIISRYTYKEKTVFVFSNCTPNANSNPFLYDCDGNKPVLTPGDYQELKFTGNIELIWKNYQNYLPKYL